MQITFNYHLNYYRRRHNILITSDGGFKLVGKSRDLLLVIVIIQHIAGLLSNSIPEGFLKMVLMKVFQWTFELPLSTTWQAAIPKPKETGWHYSAMAMIVFVIVGTSLILFIYFYAYATEAKKFGRRFATPEFPALGSDKKRQNKRRKSKKTTKQRMTKAQRLLEVNRKWSEVYCSENSDCEEPEHIATVPFGSLEITDVKKVSFRDSIQDVYFIESKEEMKRLEKLQRMGYDVTITRPQYSARDDHASKKTTKTAVCEEKETVLARALCSTFENCIYKKEDPDSLGVLKKRVNATDFQIEDVKTINDEDSFENRIFKDEERLLEIPSFIESSV